MPQYAATRSQVRSADVRYFWIHAWMSANRLSTRLPEGALLAQIPASQSDLEWTSTARLQFLPLTGLTRKVLQRLGVMSLPKLHIS